MVYFSTHFDIAEGDDGVLESTVRLDQVLAKKGDRLWYEYDFGDSWDHIIEVEAVTDEPPAAVRCAAGQLACPPEDCGGVGGYAELARWVRGGSDPSAVPPQFEDAAHAHAWLPDGWHPDRFDLDETNAALAVALAPPIPVADGLADLIERLEYNGNRALAQRLAYTAASDITVETDAARLVAPYAALLDVIGDGAPLTAAGYLRPTMIEQVAERTGLTTWWIGKANREDLTPPVARLRSSARALGLVTVRKGKLLPTGAARTVRDDPLALWQHIVRRLPLGTSEFELHAGWMALAVAASGCPAEEWSDAIRTLLLDIGWRATGSTAADCFYAGSPTLDALEFVSGQLRLPRLTGIDPAIVATARAVIIRADAPDPPATP